MIKKPSKSDYLVMLGIDTDEKPHAAVFSVADEPIVRKAAEQMGMRLGRASDDKTRALARKIPEGKLFGTGKALVPLVKHAIYDELLKTLSFGSRPDETNGPRSVPGAATPSSDKPAAGQTGSAARDPWSGIKVGSVVLCHDDSNGDDGGWWESIVMTIAPDNETMILRWRGYPKLKSFRAKRHAVGVLGPEASAKPTRA